MLTLQISRVQNDQRNAEWVADYRGASVQRPRIHLKTCPLAPAGPPLGPSAGKPCGQVTQCPEAGRRTKTMETVARSPGSILERVDPELTLAVSNRELKKSQTIRCPQKWEALRLLHV